jgi:hypothetical protein
VRWARHGAAKPGDPAQLRLATGKTCRPEHWSLTKQRVVKDLAAGKTNKRLGGLEVLTTDMLDKAAVLGEYVTAQQLREAITTYVKYNGEAPPPPPPAKPAPGQTIADVVARWQQQLRGQRSSTYLRLMTPVVTYWDAFRPGTLLTDLLPDPTTGRSEIVEQWISYLLEDVPRRGAPGEFGLDNNTAGTYVKRLRTLLQFAGLPYAWLKDELTYDIDIEPLEYEEVLQLARAPLPRVALERARDCFVFNCFTGPRYGNLKNLHPGDVRLVGGVPVLEYAQQKGRKKTKVKVALDPIAYEIWQRYAGQLPVHSNQQMNTLIKEAAQLVGLNRPISVVRQYGSQQQTLRGPIHEFITCHLARHTFATLLLDGGASIVEAQDGLGHSSLQSTRRYAKAREKQRHASTLSAFDKLRSEHSAHLTVPVSPLTHDKE